MSAPTASRTARPLRAVAPPGADGPDDGADAPRRRRPPTSVCLAAALVLTVTAAAVGRSLLAGRTDPGPPRVGAGAGLAINPPTDPLAALRSRAAARPDDATGWQALAAADVARANATGDPALYDSARSAIARARALAPDDVRTLVAAAVVSLGVHDFTAAGVDAERAVAADPFDADALAAAVDAAVETGEYDRAAERLQALLDLRPGAPALARASYLQELHGELTAARATMARAEAATATAAERSSLSTYAGDVALAAGDVTAAGASYDRALALDPQRVTAALGRARVQLAQGDLAGARATAQAVLDRSPLPAAAALVADLADVAGDAATAASARQLVAANTQLVAAAGVTVDLEAAIDAADHGDPAAAVTLARRAHDTRRTVFTADALGWSLTRSGRADEALAFVDESLRLGTASASLHLHAAAAYAAAGRRADATTQLGAALALSPWPAFHLRPEAARLAADLGVTLPTAWRS